MVVVVIVVVVVVVTSSRRRTSSGSSSSSSSRSSTCNCGRPRCRRRSRSSSCYFILLAVLIPWLTSEPLLKLKLLAPYKVHIETQKVKSPKSQPEERQDTTLPPSKEGLLRWGPELRDQVILACGKGASFQALRASPVAEKTDVQYLAFL